MSIEQQQANEEFHHMVVDALAKLVDSILTTEELTLICMACGVDTQELMGSEPYVSPPIEPL